LPQGHIAGRRLDKLSMLLICKKFLSQATERWCEGTQDRFLNRWIKARELVALRKR